MASTEHVLAREVQSLRSSMARVREKSAKEISLIVDAGITGASAFGFAYLEGRYPDKAQVGGVPLSLVAGAGIVGASLMKWIPESQRQYGAALGAGAIAAHAAITGYAKGQAAASGQ